MSSSSPLPSLLFFTLFFLMLPRRCRACFCCTLLQRAFVARSYSIILVAVVSRSSGVCPDGSDYVSVAQCGMHIACCLAFEAIQRSFPLYHHELRSPLAYRRQPQLSDVLFVHLEPAARGFQNVLVVYLFYFLCIFLCARAFVAVSRAIAWTTTAPPSPLLVSRPPPPFFTLLC